MNKTILVAVIALIVIIGGYFLFRGGSEPEVAPLSPEVIKTTQPPPAVEDSSESPVPEVREITVSGTQFAFSPSVISVREGERVRIVFRNEGSVSHNLKIEGLGIGTRTIQGGEVDTVEFTAPSSGTYAVYCSVGSHRALGMEGDLIVE